MVPLPLFKLAALFVRHVSKYGANRIKAQAHDHARFRALAARYGQSIHQLNMRLSVALLRDPEAERRARERAEAPTVKTEEQQRRDEARPKKSSPFALPTVWRRKFRPLPENKAVDLFADVAGDVFILAVATGLIVYEYWRAQQKPDINRERIEDLTSRLDDLKRRDDERRQADADQRQRLDAVEASLRALVPASSSSSSSSSPSPPLPALSAA